jgi:hypothetical protein
VTRAGRHTLALGLFAAVSVVLSWRVLDLVEYARYAHALFRPPMFSRWPHEYPPASVLVMLPTLGGRWAFYAAALLAAMVLQYRLEQANTAWAARWLWLVGLGGLAVVVGRYDIWPTLCVTLAVLAGRAGRWRAAWWWSVAAAALKLFGAVLWPVLLVAEWRETRRVRWDRLGWAVGVFAATFLLPAMRAGSRAFSAWRWFIVRPVEVESLAAPLVAALGGRLRFVYGSVSILSRWDRPAEVLITLVGLAGIAGTLYVFYRGRITWERAAALAVTWLVLGGKVLSAQYLLWLYPLWVIAWPDGLPATTYATAALTTLLYPVASTFWAGTPLYWAVDAGRGLALLAVGLNGRPWMPLVRLAVAPPPDPSEGT